MRRLAFIIAVVFFTVPAVIAQSQEGAANSPTFPVAVRSQAECTGFIASPPIRSDLYVLGGADDDFHSIVRQFVQGESIFISPPKAGNIVVGAEYSVIRPANELFLTMHYSAERWEIHKSGQPYEDVGQVRVSHVNPEGVVAKVAFSCGPIMSGDLLVPFQPRPIPTFALTPPLDHFLPMEKDKKHGRITASENNVGFFGKETVVYLNLGEGDGIQSGQRFKIYKILAPSSTGLVSGQQLPPEIIGEAVVLSVQAKSCAAMVISSYREISAGDYVEKE